MFKHLLILIVLPTCMQVYAATEDSIEVAVRESVAFSGNSFAKVSGMHFHYVDRDIGNGIRSQPIGIDNRQLNSVLIEPFSEKGVSGSATGFMVSDERLRTSPGECDSSEYFCPYNNTGNVNPLLITNRHTFDMAKAPFYIFTFHMMKESELFSPNEFKIASIKVPWSILKGLMFYHPEEYLFHNPLTGKHEVDLSRTVDLVLIEMHSIFKEALKHPELKGFWPLYYGLTGRDIGLGRVDPFGSDGAKAFLYGYPRGMHDEANYMPERSEGKCSSDPKVKRDGKDEVSVDIASFKGQSGAPVFVEDEIVTHTGYGSKTIHGVDTRFIGVFSRVFNPPSPVFVSSAVEKDVGSGISGAIRIKGIAKELHVRDPMHLGLVIHQRVVSELVVMWLERKKGWTLRSSVPIPGFIGSLLGGPIDPLIAAMHESSKAPLAKDVLAKERAKGKTAKKGTKRTFDKV